MTNIGNLSLTLTARDVQPAVDEAIRRAVTNLAALVGDDPVLLGFLRELRPTSYHWIATRGEGEAPTTGGHYDDFLMMREECELLLSRPDIPFWESVRRIDIMDACGQVVWSKERA